ncbi:hypothetical protein KKC_01352 [Listeria fleischmannii subsp. coloradonensis]|nr:hypothetical protein KKC_01352 [Listeria fleischmannii subsp. coloradonensis]STY35282.1 Uncharacterised protein [Listeria fleischmannii subsp. coloradonensis]
MDDCCACLKYQESNSDGTLRSYTAEQFEKTYEEVAE